MELYRALGISSGDVVAFAGAGGKSNAIIAVAGELAQDGMSVLVAPTTKMLVREAERIGPLVTSEDTEELRARVREALAGSPGVVAGSGLLSKGRVSGVEPAWISTLSELADVTLVEADGSRRRPLKGTADHEPVLPESSTLAVAVGSIRAYGMPANEEHIHRPEIFSRLTGVGPDQSITAPAFAQALAQGSLGNLPPTARPAALLTDVEPGQSMADAAVVTRELWRLGVQTVVLCSLPAKAPAQVWIP